MFQLKGSLWDQNTKPKSIAPKEMCCALEIYSAYSGETHLRLED